MSFCLNVDCSELCTSFSVHGPVVRTLIRAYPGLKFNPGYFIFCPKEFAGIIFSILLKHPTTQLQKKKEFYLISFCEAFTSALTFCTRPALSNATQVFDHLILLSSLLMKILILTTKLSYYVCTSTLCLTPW